MLDEVEIDLVSVEPNEILSPVRDEPYCVVIQVENAARKSLAWTSWRQTALYCTTVTLYRHAKNISQRPKLLTDIMVSSNLHVHELKVLRHDVEILTSCFDFELSQTEDQSFESALNPALLIERVQICHLCKYNCPVNVVGVIGLKDVLIWSDLCQQLISVQFSNVIRIYSSKDEILVIEAVW